MTARIRTIKPEFFSHEELFDAEAESGLPLRVAFAGLWTQCDREGRFAWRPRTLKSAILPFDDVDFSRVLDALATRGFVVRYASGEREFGVIPTWHRHQVINHRERASAIPEPPDDAGKSDASATRAPRVQGMPGGKGKEGKGKEAPDGASSANDADHSRKSSTRKIYPADFEAAWAAYPTSRNMSKAEALPHWVKLGTDDRALVVASISGYRAHLKAHPDLEVIHFCRYLSKRRFEGHAAAPAAVVAETSDLWSKRLTWARHNGSWFVADWGPMPGQPQCRVPADLLREGDGDGWADQRKAA